MSDYDRSPSIKQDTPDQKPAVEDSEMRDRSRSPRSPPRSRSRSRSRGRSRSRSVSRSPRRSRSPAPRSRSPAPRSRSPAHRSSSRRDDSRDRGSRRRRSYSRSRSRSKRRRSFSPRRRSRSPRPRSHGSRSSRNKEFHGTREAPEESNILGVFGLSLRTREMDLEDVFREFGEIEKVTVVYDHRTNRSRGFGFVYFKDQTDATKARDALNGTEIDDRRIRVDYSVTHRPHTPTPGEYMGERRRGGGYERDRYRHSRRRERSRTPPRRRYYRSRSRSRSWSR